MATAPAAAAQQPLPTNQTGNLVANIQALLQTFGGTKTTTSSNPGDTAALQNVLGQLQGADYNAMLQSIFQQAGGQIPGLQTALGNAVGARSGGNSAVAAALQKLLQQTTIAGQEQIAKQQLANQQTQVQAGQAVAQATKGTQSTQQQGTNVAGGAANLAKAAALTQLLGSALKLSGKGTLQEAIGSIGSSLGGATASTPAPAFNGPLPQQDAGVLFPSNVVTSAPAAPQMSQAPNMGGVDLAALLGSPAPAVSTAADAAAPAATAATDGGGGVSYTPDFAPLDINQILGGSIIPEPDMSYAPDEWFQPAFNINNYLN